MIHSMKQIAQILLFDRNNRLIIYLRDDKPEIPFANHWDLIGGHLEEGETAEVALVREVREEIGLELGQWQFFRRYECLAGDVFPNTKFIYHARIDCLAVELTLFEGQRLSAIEPQERFTIRFANILGTILEDFIAAGVWPQAVDNSRANNFHR
ncbi:MAG: 7,8-dihydro-8-oxoguanine triphosphatase [Deltaproteobacteria bacterium]|nr:7,8-dihydro-8-oxoguanine triphosphatase [Deltaproteobacteria bacterium]